VIKSQQVNRQRGRTSIGLVCVCVCARLSDEIVYTHIALVIITLATCSIQHIACGVGRPVAWLAPAWLIRVAAAAAAAAAANDVRNQ